MEAAVPHRMKSARSPSGGLICHRAGRADDRCRSERTLQGNSGSKPARNPFRVPPLIGPLLMRRQIAGLATEIER